MKLNLLIFLFLCADLHASNTPKKKPCGSFFTNIEIPERLHLSVESNPKKKKEKESAGQLLNKKSTPTKKGRYLYLIGEKGVLFAPFVEIEVTAQDHLYVSHGSLITKYKKLFNDDHFLAAGEFYLGSLDGKTYVQEVNNCSGRLRGNAAHLDFATKVLQKNGLNVSPETALQNYAIKKPWKADKHFEQGFLATSEVKLSGSRLHQSIDKLISITKEKFPHPTIPHTIDNVKIADFFAAKHMWERKEGSKTNIFWIGAVFFGNYQSNTKFGLIDRFCKGADSLNIKPEKLVEIYIDFINNS